MPIAKPLEERFWPKVRKSDGCWIWTAYKDKNGYGSISVGGRAGHARLAHRVSYELNVGPIPDELFVLHRCDNPSCVRPDHLFLGDQAANMADCSAKRRTTHGERSSNVKLTEEKVIEIRRRHKAGEASYAVLGREYGLARFSIRDIIRRRRWPHVM